MSLKLSFESTAAVESSRSSRVESFCENKAAFFRFPSGSRTSMQEGRMAEWQAD